jgi:hypothetical protein
MKRIVGEDAWLLVAIFAATLAVSAATGGSVGAFYITPVVLYALALLLERRRESGDRAPKGRSGGGRNTGSR